MAHPHLLPAGSSFPRGFGEATHPCWISPALSTALLFCLHHSGSFSLQTHCPLALSASIPGLLCWLGRGLLLQAGELNPSLQNTA